MNLRAVIFDIYGTLLEVGLPPADAAERWIRLAQLPGQTGPPLFLAAFSTRCQAAIAVAHAAAKSRGVAFPEVYWPDIARTALPDLASLSETALDEFLYQHARLERTVRLMPGAAAALEELSRRQVVLGLCSNCQPYTLRELSGALAGAGLSMEMFHPRLRFFSFQAGFSKPAPAVFEWLKGQLRTLDIAPAQALMVGDRLENDILPAQAQGWQTWHLSRNSSEERAGDWAQLLESLRQRCR